MLLAGGGAVGSAFIHVAWATPQLEGELTVADADELGVDLSNLNRCVIFGRTSLGQPKASEAARVCSDASLRLIPHDGLVQEVADPTKMLASAVDTNSSRQAVADMYPARLLSASTLDLRAEILRCDPTSDGACVRCFNTPETLVADNDQRRAFLNAGAEAQEALARRVGLSRAEAERWAVEGTCSHATDRLLAHMRESTAGPGAFAVGFVSVTAGLMLFAQAAREELGDPLLTPPLSRAGLTFFDLSAPTNVPRAYARDATCPACAPNTPAMAIWSDRYRVWSQAS